MDEEVASVALLYVQRVAIGVSDWDDVLECRAIVVHVNCGSTVDNSVFLAWGDRDLFTSSEYGVLNVVTTGTTSVRSNVVISCYCIVYCFVHCVVFVLVAGVVVVDPER